MPVDYFASPERNGFELNSGAPERTRRTQLLTFVIVSAGCAAAAIATGSYALWLSRHQLAGEALTNVRDILKTCQDRVTQMEEELSHLPARSPSVTITA